ncbi:helix-turn-helix transcriptional regulator [Paraburkholderia gardini]|nr:LuxR family transcriptional regulator [Paraburkholderia gardini]
MMNHVLPRRANGESSGLLPAGKSLKAAALTLAMPFACAVDVPSLVDSFESAVHALGFPYYVISRVARSGSSSAPRTVLELICAQYPDDWLRHYQHLNYASTDPVHRAAFARAVPYRWQDITGMNRAERRVLDEARDAGLPGGLSIPVHQPGGSILLFSLSGPPHSVNTAIDSRLAYIISTQFHLELQRLAPIPRRRPAHFLSPRQRECLAWVAQGKTSWEISRILNLSPHTVDYHIGEAMERLNVHSRTAAAVNATVQGFVQI